MPYNKIFCIDQIIFFKFILAPMNRLCSLNLEYRAYVNKINYVNYVNNNFYMNDMQQSAIQIEIRVRT